MFQRAASEWQALMLQSATSNRGRGGRRKPPFVFTGHGASVLSTPVAVQASIQVVRAFVRLRGLLAAHREFARQLATLEQKVEGHDAAIRKVFEALRQLMAQPEPRGRRIGFLVKEGTARYRAAHPRKV
jgi:hypothetical protein